MVVNIDEMSLGGSPMIQWSRAGTQTVKTWGENSGEHFLTVTHTCSVFTGGSQACLSCYLHFCLSYTPFPNHFPIKQTNQGRKCKQYQLYFLYILVVCLAGQT